METHHADLEAIRPVKVVQTSELQLELESLAEEIQKDKDKWAKQKREEETTSKAAGRNLHGRPREASEGY